MGWRVLDSQSTKVKRTEKIISKPEDFTNPEALYDQLIQTIQAYHPSTDISMIEKAYNIARDAHQEQKRKLKLKRS